MVRCRTPLGAYLRFLSPHVVTSVLSLALTNATGAVAASVELASYRIDVEQGSLDDVVAKIAQQTNVQIAHLALSNAASIRIGPLHGNFTMAQALQRLLAGTGLTFRFANERTIAIFNIANEVRSVPAQPDATSDDIVQERRRSWLERLSIFFSACDSTSATATCASSSESLEEVIVTGSRIIRGDKRDSPNPVTVVTSQQLMAVHPSTVFEALLDLPQFGGSRSTIGSNPGGAGGVNGQVSAFNQRGMGPVRTLVLYDGHRLPPTQQNFFVDANTVPQMLLQRVDVVTGGTSAIYGSDAISGVVNYISDRNFQGLKVNAQMGVANQGDEPSHQLGLAFGTKLFDGRAHVSGSILHHYDAGILHRSDREQFKDRWVILNDGLTAATPYYLASGATLANLTFGGKILGPANNPLANTQFISNGVLAPFVNGAPAGNAAGNTQIGGDGAYNTDFTLKSQVKLNQVYGRFDFNVTDDLRWYVSMSGTDDRAFSYSTNNRLTNITMSASNPFLPAVYRQQLAAAGITTFTFGKMWSTSVVPALNADFLVHHRFYNTGLEGKLGNYRWQASFMHVDSRLNSRNNASVNNGRLFAALDAVTNSTGQVVCNVTLTNPSLYPDCVPINVFGPTSETPAAVNYFLDRSEFTTKLPSNDLSASISGAPFEAWAGPVNMALSGEWRQQGLQVDSTALPTLYDPLNCAGLQPYYCTPKSASSLGTSKWANSVAARPMVTMEVSEVALEADFPLLKGQPLAQDVSLNTAGRYAKYTVEGNPDTTAANLRRDISATTWKLGLDWQINDAFTLRGTHSRDIRAPNLSDLYAPVGLNLNVTAVDLLNKVVPTGAVTQSGGNPDLSPEIASTTTIGMVFKPTDNFSVTVDAFRIVVNDAINNMNGTETYAQQACYAGSAFFCSLQERDPLTNQVTKWYNRPLNVAQLSTEGIDVEANYSTTLAGNPLSLRGFLSYQPHVLLKVPGAITTDYAATTGAAGANQAGPKLRLMVMAHYNLTEKWSLDWQTRWRDRLKHNPNAALFGTPGIDPAPVAYSNLNLSYKLATHLNGQADVFLNIQNIFNQRAPLASVAGVQADPGIFGGYAPGDDPTGRYFTVGFRYRL